MSKVITVSSPKLYQNEFPNIFRFRQKKPGAFPSDIMLREFGAPRAGDLLRGEIS